MERSNKFAARRTSRFPGSTATRQGKFTFVVLIAILGMMVIIGFVGNAGYIVTEKMNTQNAADAIAFSSAQWMARGMNSVTATNHLLGEITGLVVVIEALGGPEADREMEAYPPQSRVTDSINQNFVNLAVIDGLAVYGAPAAGKIDKPFLNAIVTKLVSRKDAKHKAFATIYDAKLQLKKSTATRLIFKSVANAGLWVPPPWGWISAIAAYVIHIKANADLLEIGKEYVILEGFERLVTSGIVRNLKVKVIEEKLIPAIAAHGDYLAGRNSLIAKKRPKVNSSVVNNAVTGSLEHLSKVYNVKAAIYPTNKMEGIPGTSLQLAKLRLPIAPEAPPSMSGTAAGKYEAEWGSDEVKESDDKDPIAKIQRELAEARQKAEQRIKELNEQIKMLEGLSNEVQDLKQMTGVNQEERAAFQKEQTEISTDITEKKKTLKERQDDLVKIKEQQKKIDEAKKELEKIPPGTGNLSMRPQHLALSGIQSSGATNGTREVGMNMAEERTTQWVRATYPYVDAFRAPILAMFREHMDISDAADHYKKWTDRYTLTKSWQFRSGYMFDGKKGSEAVATWKKDTRTEPLRMYLMVETFDPDKAPGIARPGAKRIQKGYEVWTKDDTKGKEMAEKMITVVGMTQRDITPFFSKVLFPVANKHGMTTFAQALYYNSNEQKPGTLGKPGKTQAILGWDTLNWDPTTTVPEWGTELTKSKAKWPWDLFTSSTDWQGNAKVKLNWQAKLMPVTHSRLLPATAAALIESTDMAQNIKWALPPPVFERMVTH